MEFKNQEVPAGILLKIKKLKALAERGIGGEAVNAQTLLSSLCEKYGIKEEELDKEEEFWYDFEMRESVKGLFLQVYVSIYGTTEKYLKGIQFWKRGSKKIIRCKLTPSEFIELSQLWEWHRKNYLAERKRMRELFKRAYYHKFHLFPKETCEEFEEMTKDKKEDSLSMEDLWAIEGMVSACKDKTFHKQLESKDDEDDED